MRSSLFTLSLLYLECNLLSRKTDNENPFTWLRKCNTSRHETPLNFRETRMIAVFKDVPERKTIAWQATLTILIHPLTRLDSFSFGTLVMITLSKTIVSWQLLFILLLLFVPLVKNQAICWEYIFEIFARFLLNLL